MNGVTWFFVLTLTSGNVAAPTQIGPFDGLHACLAARQAVAQHFQDYHWPDNVSPCYSTKGDVCDNTESVACSVK